MLDSEHNFYAKIQNTKNYLLVKDDVGKSKPITRNLPTNGFSYGIKVLKDKEDARAVISSWAEHSKRLEKSLDQDFRRLNILSIGEKKLTAPQQREFRKTADNRRMSSIEPKNRENSIEKIYGMPLRPSTPIKAVLGNFYGQVAVEKTHYMYSDQSRVQNVRNRNMIIEKAPDQVQKELFKMRKFLKITARTSTRRSKSMTR